MQIPLRALEGLVLSIIAPFVFLIINHHVYVSDTARTWSLLPSHKFLPAWEMSETTTSPSHMYLLQGKWHMIMWQSNTIVPLSHISLKPAPFLLIWGGQKVVGSCPGCFEKRLKNANKFLFVNVTFCFFIAEYSPFYVIQIKKMKVWTNCLSNKVCVFLVLKVLKVRHTFPCQPPRLHTIFML